MDDDGPLVFIIFLLFVAVFFAGCALGGSLKQDEAVEAGCAEYYLDGLHNKQFRWKAK